MKYLVNKFIILTLALLTGCSSIPNNTANSCSIFNERYLWYKHTKKVEEKWGTPIYIQLAIIKMESDFDWLAKPARQKIFKVIPFKSVRSLVFRRIQMMKIFHHIQRLIYNHYKLLLRYEMVHQHHQFL
mgnify:CR=1 FL=1